MLFTEQQKKMVEKFYPNYKEDPFRKLLEDEVRTSHVVLDAGCGDGRLFKYNFKDLVKMLIGTDLGNDLRLNQQVHFSTFASIESLPFKNETFDLIFLRYVLEHLENPAVCFSEFYRLLKPTGQLIIITPNKFHYFVLIGRLIPHSLQQAFVKRKLKYINFDNDDVHRTYYRCNSIGDMIKIATKACLKTETLFTFEVWPILMAFSSMTFYPAVAYERLANGFPFLAPFRSQLIGVFKKGDCENSTNIDF